jgi:hypothetical protein
MLPRQWAKPEVLVAIQNNLTMNGAGASSGGLALQQMVIADLQFSKLRANEAYSHHRPEQPANAREVEVCRVDPDLSGHLTRTDCPGAVVSESQAAENQRRVERVNAQIDALFAAKRGGNGTSPSRPSTNAGDQSPSNALVLGPIRWPQSAIPSAVWWAQFTTGDAGREVERETAIKAVKHVARELLGEWQSQGVSVDFTDGEIVTVRTVVALVEELPGGEGWPTLLKLAGHSG